MLPSCCNFPISNYKIFEFSVQTLEHCFNQLYLVVRTEIFFHEYLCKNDNNRSHMASDRNQALQGLVGLSVGGWFSQDRNGDDEKSLLSHA